ncbi:MAG: UPF0175 family protein [Bacteroidales bacterium]|nr:UPF0175 family protein [Bacteroidales bacterium]MCF8456372.1 UPF0175 family protein [Bacteroidales bacterium]
MHSITLEIPDVIMKSYGQNIGAVRDEMKRGLIVLEYLNGHLSIGECGEILKIGYRGFLELLWDRGIPIDTLNENELDLQISQLRNVTTNG